VHVRSMKVVAADRGDLRKLLQFRHN
jgi:hypothetical protein